MMKHVLIIAAIMLSGCSENGEYVYTPRITQETPAVLQFLQGYNPEKKTTPLGRSITRYSDEVRVSQVNRKWVGGFALIPEDSNEVVRTNRVLLSPGMNEVRFLVKTKYLTSLSFTLNINAQPNEVYSLNLLLEAPKSSDFSMHAGHASFPLPTVQLLDSRGQILQTVTFKPNAGTSSSMNCSSGNAKIYGNPCPVSTRKSISYEPVYLSPTAP